MFYASSSCILEFSSKGVTFATKDEWAAICFVVLYLSYRGNFGRTSAPKPKNKNWDKLKCCYSSAETHCTSICKSPQLKASIQYALNLDLIFAYLRILFRINLDSHVHLTGMNLCLWTI